MSFLELHNEVLNDLYYLINIIRLIKWKRIKCPRHVPRTGERRGFWLGNLRERDHLEYTGLDGRVILRWIFRNWDGGHRVD